MAQTGFVNKSRKGREKVRLNTSLASCRDTIDDSHRTEWIERFGSDSGRGLVGREKVDCWYLSFFSITLYVSVQLNDAPRVDDGEGQSL